MGALWEAFEKRGTGVVLVPAHVPEPVSPAVPAEWHPAWMPEVGWKSPENPTGWVQPKKPTQRKELFLWDQWKRAGETPETAAPMIDALRGLIHSQGVRGWAKRTPIATPVLEQRALNFALAGLRSLDPNKAQLNTHVFNSFKGMNRFVKERQNTTRIVEARIKHIGNIDRAVARLTEKLERDPTVLEIADEAKIPAETISKLMLERHDDRLTSGATEDPFLDEVSGDRLVLQLIRYSLTPDEEKVLDHLTGQAGARILSPGAIAKKEGWTSSKVSTIKLSLAKKIKAAR